MHITAQDRVADIAAQIPASLDVFERYGVDFACAGGQSLLEAASGQGVSVGDLITEIERAVQAETEEEELHRDWSRYAPHTLVDHIESVHHASVRTRLPKVGAQLAEVMLVHGDDHGELFELGRSFEMLRDGVTAHFEATEHQVFPAVREAFHEHELIAPPDRIEELLGWLEDLQADHEEIAGHLQAMRDVTGGYITPDDACATYSGLYRALAELEAELRRHVHLEDDILVPGLRDAFDER